MRAPCTLRGPAALAALLALAACPPPRRPLPAYKGPAQAVPLMQKVEEAETSTWKTQRTDLEIRTRDALVNPSVMRVVETPPLKLEPGMHATLAGDPQGKTGFYVDNFLLIEVLDAKGEVTGRYAVGFQEGVTRGEDPVDNLGPNAFQFDAGEIDLTDKLPENEAVRLRVTALDYGNVGKVSDVYLVLAGAKPEAGEDEELREK